jgi:hypothetical protein
MLYFDANLILQGVVALLTCCSFPMGLVLWVIISFSFYISS